MLCNLAELMTSGKMELYNNKQRKQSCILSNFSDTFIHLMHQLFDMLIKCFNFHFLPKHPLWRNSGRDGFPNDIAVVRFRQSAPVGPLVRPVALPPRHPTDFTSSECYISGWGRLYGSKLHDSSKYLYSNM